MENRENMLDLKQGNLLNGIQLHQHRVGHQVQPRAELRNTEASEKNMLTWSFLYTIKDNRCGTQVYWIPFETLEVFWDQAWTFWTCVKTSNQQMWQSHNQRLGALIQYLNYVVCLEKTYLKKSTCATLAMAVLTGAFCPGLMSWNNMNFRWSYSLMTLTPDLHSHTLSPHHTTALLLWVSVNGVHEVPPKRVMLPLYSHPSCAHTHTHTHTHLYRYPFSSSLQCPVRLQMHSAIHLRQPC